VPLHEGTVTDAQRTHGRRVANVPARTRVVRHGAGSGRARVTLPRLLRLGARREHAERYLFVVIAAFAVSVAATRWFLAATGYPKVGGGGLHIAHMLWGGLLLVVAATLPLVLVGRRVLYLAALAGGVGVGLFIDEIGKFITESNDYFFAPAAPLIYSAILLVAAFWLVLVRRRSVASAHDDLQAGVEALREAVDGHLTRAARGRALERLARVQAGPDADAAAMAAAQAELLASPATDRALAEPGWVESGRAMALFERLLPMRLERVLILLALLVAMLLAVVSALSLLAVATGVEFVLPKPSGPVEVPQESAWAVMLLVVATGVGVASAAAFVLILAGRVRTGLRIGVWATLVNLVAGGLLTFYVAQFEATASVIGHLLLLGALIDHDRRLSTPGEAAR
jgi:hypothetical protein